jgi:hypothetical protein
VNRSGTYLLRHQHWRHLPHHTKSRVIAQTGIHHRRHAPHHARRHDPTAFQHASNPSHQPQPASRQDHPTRRTQRTHTLVHGARSAPATACTRQRAGISMPTPNTSAGRTPDRAPSTPRPPRCEPQHEVTVAALLGHFTRTSHASNRSTYGDGRSPVSGVASSSRIASATCVVS